MNGRLAPRAVPPLLSTALVFSVLCLAGNRGFWRYALLERGVLSPETAAALWRHVATPLALTLVFALIAAGLGLALLRRVFPERKTEPLDGILAFALGTGLWATSIFLLGLAGRLDGLHLGGLAVLAAGAAAFGWAGTFQRLAPAARSAPPARPPWLAAVWGVLAYAAWHSLILALAPPTEWDILAYHLPIPKLYLSWGAIREVPWLLHSHWPHLMEAFYTLPLALRADTAAALFHALCCWALVGATFFAAREELGEREAWLSAAVVAAQPTLLRIAGTAHSDGAMALFQFLAGWALWRFDGARDRRWLAVAALCSGLAASCKLFGVAPIGAWALWLAWRGSRKEAAAYAALSLAVVLPWYLKAWAGSGNPVWPFFSRWLGGEFGAAIIEGPYLSSTRWPWPPEWDLFVRYGPQWLLLPLAGLAALHWKERGPFPRFVLFSFIPALTYLPPIIRQQEAWRFLLPLVPAMAMLAAWWAVRAAEPSRAPAWGAALAVAAALCPAVLADHNNELFPVSGVRSRLRPEAEPRALYLERALDHYLPYALIRRDVPPDSRILLYREVRSYYLGLDFRWGDPLNQAVIPYARLASPQELRRKLAEEGITHVLVNDQLAMYAPSQKYYDERTLLLMDETLRLFAEPPRRYGPISLYRLRR